MRSEFQSLYWHFMVLTRHRDQIKNGQMSSNLDMIFRFDPSMA